MGILALAVSGCAGPHAGHPEKLKGAPPKKKPPEKLVDNKPTDIVWDEECRANFQDEKPPKARNPGAAKAVAVEADNMLANAEKMEGEQRIRAVIDAINKLKGATGKDQFNATATYLMARAYALVYRKGCSILLLKRLNDLQVMPEVAPDADKAIKRARDDNAFKGFRKDADAALGI
ncbi:MAG TPA: hypothetical protein VL172_14140 [Kofleriaceae bacterium]|nr:hypothetical protein [Kofleriaceae bacterium]